MPLTPFVLLTGLGSLLWNTALVGAGYAFGTQYDRVEQYLQYLDYVIYLAVAAIVAWFVARKLRQRRAAAAAGSRHRA
jgi:membrane protein DedA with SNARE-associated domain